MQLEKLTFSIQIWVLEVLKHTTYIYIYISGGQYLMGTVEMRSHRFASPGSSRVRPTSASHIAGWVLKLRLAVAQVEAHPG